MSENAVESNVDSVVREWYKVKSPSNKELLHALTDALTGNLQISHLKNAVDEEDRRMYDYYQKLDEELREMELLEETSGEC